MRVSLRLQKWCYVAATGSCVVASIVMIVWGLQAPIELAGTGKPINIQDQSGPPDSAGHANDAGRPDFSQLWDRPLRRPLYDPPPPKAVVRELPPLRVDLLGTILEGDNSMAIVRSEQGKVEYKRVGDSLGPSDSPAQLAEIQADAVVLTRADDRVTLRVQGSERR